MKNILIGLGVTIVCPIIVYVCMGFCYVEFNPFNWEMHSRISLCVFGLVPGLIFGLASQMFLHKIENL